jgi:4a-hydroxytetrahydrobiopterin dehydratase
MTDPLNEAAIRDALADLNGWSLDDDRIVKQLKFHNFKQALAAIVHIGLLAESANHHPTITNTYSSVHLALNTHDAGGKVTQKDVDLAKQIDQALTR